MSTTSHAFPKLAQEREGTNWLLYLFLAAALFCVYHDISFSLNGQDSYYPSQVFLSTAVVDGSPTRRFALLALGFYAIVTLVRRQAEVRLRFNTSLGWILLSYVAWAFASVLWAEDRSLTVTRLTVFGIFCITALALARRFSLREFALWTFYTTFLFLIVGIISEVFFGRFRPLSSGYRFAGTLHPNHQGINCALLLLSGVAVMNLEKHSSALFRTGTAMGFAFLILTGSRTAAATAVMGLAVYTVAVCSGRMKLAMAYGLSALSIVVLLFLSAGFLSDVEAAINLGRNDTEVSSFSGRTGVWDAIGSYVERRPILGYGYGGFWNPAHIGEISKEEKWGIPNSHSAYLDYLLCLGIVGMLTCSLLLLTGIKRSFGLQKLTQNSAYAFCGVLLVFCAMNGFLESAPIEPSFLMLISMAILARMAFVVRSDGAENFSRRPISA